MLGGKKILITGGTGFIGTNLANALAAKNKVVALGRRSGLIPLDPRVVFIKCDITSKRFLDIIKTGSFDYIFHLAGNASQKLALDNPALDLEINFLATFKLLETIRHLKNPSRLIYASSVTVYGDSTDKKLSEENTVLQPISNYGASKLASERYLYAFVKQYGIPAITLRIFSTFGPGLNRQIVYDLISKLSKNPQEVTAFGTGKEARDFTYVDDQVKNILLIAQKAKYGGEAYNAGSGTLVTTKKVAETIVRAMRLKSKIIFTDATRVFDGFSWLADVRKMRAFGCKNTTSFENGIKVTVAWYKANFKI